MAKSTLFKQELDLGLLILRITCGGLLFYGHGLPKLNSFSERLYTFADPIGLGSEFSFILIVFAEAVCGILITLGMFTRLATIPVIIGMLVAAFVVHAGDPFRDMEVGLLYALMALALLFTGPGRWSLDAIIRKKY